MDIPTIQELTELIRAGGPGAGIAYFGWRLWPDFRAFLTRLFGPATDEVAQYFSDSVKARRLVNSLGILAAVRDSATRNAMPEGHTVNPRIAFQAFEHGSWVDDSVVQELWAGLLISSASEDGNDDSNLVFTSILERMTCMQAKILGYVCEKSRKARAPVGIISTSLMPTITKDELFEIAGSTDLHRIDRELDVMRFSGLIFAGIDDPSGTIDLTPTPFALHLYVRCQGSRSTPLEFFGVETRESS